MRGIFFVSCFFLAMACNNRSAVPGEYCFTPVNSFVTDISEACELKQKADRECYLRYSNDSKKSITCKQFDAMKSVGASQ